MNNAILYRKEAYYDLLSIVRTPSFVLPSLAFPLIFYVFFGVIFNSGGNSLYLLVSYGTFGIMGPALFNFAMNIASDRAHGWLTLKRLSPMPISAYLVAKLSTAMVFSLVIILLLFSVGFVFAGVRLAFSQWLLLGALLWLGTMPFALIGLIFGLTLSDKAAPGVVNLIYLPMAFLSGLWIPIHMMPTLLQQASWIWPSYHLSQLGLKIIEMDQGYPLWTHLLCLFAMTLLLALGTTWTFKRLTGAKA